MSPSSARRAHGAVVAWLVACVVACAGKSQNPTQTIGNTGLSCLTTLLSYCCSDAAVQSCIPDFATASQCGTWPPGVSVHVYPTTCKGMRAVRVQGTWSTLYLYGSDGQLVAIGDNAASVQDPGDTSIECGAGAPTFSVPDDCGAAWLTTNGAVACDAGATPIANYCAGR